MQQFQMKSESYAVAERALGEEFRLISTPSAQAKKSFFYIQETGHLKSDQNRNTKRQNLQSFLLVVVLDGRGTLTYGDHNYTVTKGECFFIDCRQPHAYQPDKEQPWEQLWVHFNGAASEDYYQMFYAQNGPVFCPASTAKFVTTIQEIIRINSEKSADTEILTSNLLVNLLTLLLTFHSIEVEDDVLHLKLKSILAYLDEHFSDNITLDSLARQFYISKYYLTREFKKTYGETIFQHLISLRINYAKRLLRFTDKSVEEIAELCGFNDQSYFTKQFKKAENMTCLAFRRRWRD